MPGGKVVLDLLRRAVENGPPPSADSIQGATKRRDSGGHTLGSNQVEDTPITSLNAPPPNSNNGECAVRFITFWREGFSIGDGPLMPYEDPQNARILNEINCGRAPPSLFNVASGQLVELRVMRRLNESYVPPVAETPTAISGTGLRSEDLSLRRRRTVGRGDGDHIGNSG